MLLAIHQGMAQDLSSIGKTNPVNYSGGISVNQIGYASNREGNQRDPYSYFIAGNLNLDLYGWSVPLSFSFSNQSLSFQQPFNQYSLHPTYKWVTAHLGWASMEFSPYTLSGHLFRGAGIELSPEGKFSAKAMWGRLNAPVQPDSALQIPAVYRRVGYGLSMSYTDEGDQLTFSLFQAGDDSSSINTTAYTEAYPEENLVLGLSGQKQLFNRLLLKGEIARSAITRNRSLNEVAHRGIFRLFSPLMQANESTNYYTAYNAAINYQGSFYTVGLGYERIDPEYRTHGAYYFNNDLENISINSNAALLSGKINLGFNIGLQKNNLNDEKLSSMNRTVASATIAYAASDRLNFNGSYSNFQTFTNIRPQFDLINQLTPYDNLDTLNFTQITQNANLAVNFALQTDKERRQALSANLSYQDAADKQGGESSYAGTQFYNGNLGYNLSITPQSLTVSAGVNYSRNQLDTLATITQGPTLSLAKGFFQKKLRTTLSYNWNESFRAGDKLSSIQSVRAGASYTIRKLHNLSLNLVGIQRSSSTAENTNEFKEFTATLGYSFSFSSRNRKQENEK